MDDDKQDEPTTESNLPAKVFAFGTDISRGRWVYCAYDGERLVVVAATAREARIRYRSASIASARPCRLKPAKRTIGEYLGWHFWLTN